MTCLSLRPAATALVAAAAFFCSGSRLDAAEAPRSVDPRLVVELVAEAPDVVHPIACAFDSRGRLLVIESHTHFRPNDYKGPPKDRIRLLKDANGDGKAEEVTTFYEGTTATMDLAAAPDGSIYVASRSEILRLRDDDGDGVAEKSDRVIFLDTAGNYPHNGLSGLSFDAAGDLWFGMGENLGASYTVRGTAGPTISGEGDGGHVFRCSPDGTNLVRVATGFWNPFGATRDVFGNLFVVDNDPDASPPCRMLHVAAGGDYGFQFRYGRSGRHVFQSWNGQNWGTLPQVAGTGESPCAVHCYESDGLPDEYRGELLVAAWADHRIERYTLEPRGASYAAVRKPFITGPVDFRPVGLAVAPDGSLYITDWVLSNYNLHGRGAVWRVRPKEPKKVDPATSPRDGLASRDRATREAAARALAKAPDGVEVLRRRLETSDDARVSAAILDALALADRTEGFDRVANGKGPAALRAMAVRLLVEDGKSTASFLAASNPPNVIREAVFTPATDATTLAPRIVELLASDDPFLRQAAVQRMSTDRSLRVAVAETPSPSAAVRRGLVLAERAAGEDDAGAIGQFLLDPDDEVRFLALKWISDDRLGDLRPAVAEMLSDSKLNIRLYVACATALARLDGKPVNENSLADFLFTRLIDEKAPSATRVLALRGTPAKHPKLTLELLEKLALGPDEALGVEAVRAIAEHPNNARRGVLEKLMESDAAPSAARREAVASLAAWGHEYREPLVKLAVGDDAALADEAMRALVRVNLPNEDQEKLKLVAEKRPAAAPLVDRLLGRPFYGARPAATDLDGWLKLAEGTGNAEAGRHVFTNAKLVNCAKCHRVDGRGGDVGPDLSTIGLQEPRRNVESIVQPSAVVAPHYQVWAIETADGRSLNGMLVHTQLDETTYIDARGERFNVRTPDVVEQTPVPVSIMPTGLPDQLTDQEFRDLLTYLSTRK